MHAYKHTNATSLTMQIILMELASVTLPEADRSMGFNVTASEET